MNTITLKIDCPEDIHIVVSGKEWVFIHNDGTPCGNTRIVEWWELKDTMEPMELFTE